MDVLEGGSVEVRGRWWAGGGGDPVAYLDSPETDTQVGRGKRGQHGCLRGGQRGGKGEMVGRGGGRGGVIRWHTWIVLRLIHRWVGGKGANMDVPEEVGSAEVLEGWGGVTWWHTWITLRLIHRWVGGKGANMDVPEEGGSVEVLERWWTGCLTWWHTWITLRLIHRWVGGKGPT